MRRVGYEVPLRLERCLQPPEQAIERLSELPELVVRAVEGEALVQVPGGDIPGGGGDRAQRPQDPPGDQPADPESEDGQDHDHGHARHILACIVGNGAGERRARLAAGHRMARAAGGARGGLAAGVHEKVRLEDFRGGQGDG
jgi:hypothetical protein